MQNILLKDQFIFGVTVHEIQEHLLNKIGDDHDINQCLQEARKIESHIAQCKLLGLKSVHYDSIGQRDHGRSMKTRFKVDTGAYGNLLPLGEFFKHFPNANMIQLAKTIDPHTKLYAYNNTEIKQLGVCELLVEYQTHRKICEFYVVDFPAAILGKHDSESLKLITVHFDSIEAETSHTELLKGKASQATPMNVNAIQGAEENEFTIKIKCDYKDLFTGIGNMNTVIYIKLKDNAVPYVVPIRRVAHALQEPLHLELEKLVDEGILRKLKIDEKSEWLNSFICVRKPNGSIRLCLDPTHLNKYILRPHHNSKTLDDILPKLSGAKKFSKVDSTKSFFNLGLTKIASLSSDMYQCKVDEIFEDIPQCVGIADDIVIFGYNDHDHDATLYSVLDRARDIGMKFNPDKCVFKQDSISFYGVTLSAEGVKSDPRKIDAIKNLPEPRTEALLQSFFGIVNYLSRFSPNIAKMTCNLRALLKKNTEFLWLSQHSEDFKCIVQELCSSKLLKYYDSTKNLYLEVEASQKAIGMGLLQSVCEDFESEADGCQQNWVETNVNDCEKNHYS